MDSLEKILMQSLVKFRTLVIKSEDFLKKPMEGSIEKESDLYWRNLPHFFFFFVRIAERFMNKFIEEFLKQSM